MSKAFSDFDNDYRDGLVGESLTAEIIQTAEVKTDYQWQRTGNFYIEYECFYNNINAWAPSGIEVTTANYWSLVMPIRNKKPIVLDIPTSLLKKVCKGASKAEMNDGLNPSKGYLVKVSQIFEAVRNATT